MLVRGFAIVKLFPLQKPETSILCGTFIVFVDIRLRVQRKKLPRETLLNLINGEYKNAPRDLKASILHLQSVMKSEIFTALFRKIQVF
jgi:hypothetical protein